MTWLWKHSAGPRRKVPPAGRFSQQRSFIHSHSKNCVKARNDSETAGTFLDYYWTISRIHVAKSLETGIGQISFFRLVLVGERKARFQEQTQQLFLRLYCPFSFDDMRHFFQPLFSMSVTSTKKTDLSTGRQMTEKHAPKKKKKKKREIKWSSNYTDLPQKFSDVSTSDTTLPVSPAQRQALRLPCIYTQSKHNAIKR